MCTFVNRFEEEEGALADMLTELGAEKADNIQTMLQEVRPQLVFVSSMAICHAPISFMNHCRTFVQCLNGYLDLALYTPKTS